mmetsp:Transcript_16619/g.18602  ORF Transcript_16619/g.18602 Transcript_16619/m.18602 type:complete len:226 (-) Transcript_16619:153-830(-)|eukprot:CAMPEP_0170765244 /NCGR_PEP_ID=MMETSP0733-20121128/4491_1 /TAXON_ID=186038 /ORGANISM="Fragilariopsis kerguelensis, Strain L26-C5" /LENGTH=225 /DNA_ID=CAMNT_0011106061 /DNA_START=78 /DNA_END=755 /DNA_ORIENTATION=-
MLAAHHPVNNWNFIWDEKHLGIQRDFELMGMEKRRLLRLRPDYKDEADWFPTTRTEFMTVAAREALKDDSCTVVGGFIRDWIIRGEEPKDLDLRIDPDFNAAAFIKRCEKWDLHPGNHVGGISKSFILSTPKGDDFLVDTSIGNIPIDLDVNNFAITAKKGLHKREYKKRPFCKTYGNIKRKVAYLINNDPGNHRCDYIKARVTKMEDRGWTIIRSEALAKNCAC